MRLWLVLQLQTKLERPKGGWIKPRKQLLEQVELPRQVRNVIASLERAGLIEVQRQPEQTGTGEAGNRPPRAEVGS